ncbi:MAG: RNA 2',3'-cyclic phosphodiesterase [Alphaproteobacteria bacterium]
MIRLFVGLSIPESLQARLTGLCGGVPGARWVRPENFHVTLRFIGDIGENLAEDVDAALSRITAPSFTLEVAGVGQFGKGVATRALWAGIAPNPALNHLRSKIETAVTGAGLPAETRKFKPHITLGRLKNPPPDRVGNFIVDHAGLRAGTFPVDRFTLFSSFLSSSGAIYTPEVDYELE